MQSTIIEHLKFFRYDEWHYNMMQTFFEHYQSSHTSVAILKGKKPGNMPIEFVRHGQPILNLKQARKLGLNVPQHFEHEARTKGVIYK